MKVRKASIFVRIKRRIFCFLMERFNRTPKAFRYRFSKWMNKPVIDKTASIAGTPVFIGNVKIGKYTYLNGEAFLEHVEIGNYCSIGRDLSIISGNHQLNDFSTYPFWAFNKKSPFSGYLPEVGNAEDYVSKEKHTIIEHDVWIGSYVKIIGGLTIGTGAVIGAGSVVTKDVPPYAIVAGVPAKIIKYRFDEDTIKRLLDSKWWNLSSEELINEWDNLEKCVRKE